MSMITYTMCVCVFKLTDDCMQYDMYMSSVERVRSKRTLRMYKPMCHRSLIVCHSSEEHVFASAVWHSLGIGVTLPRRRMPA